MTIIFQFPGQSSRYARMINKLYGLSTRSREIIDRASAVLERDLLAHYDRGDEAYRSNRDIQIAVFLANHIFLEELTHAGVEAVLSAGLSLGEWNHLVHIGALDFDSALQAVERRGEAYDAGPRGTMAAVFPMAADELSGIVEAQRNGHVLEVVNLNSPRQSVIAGHEEAVTKAAQVLEDENFVNVTIIERRIPMHSTLFEGVARQFSGTLESLRFTAPHKPYVPNRLGRLFPDPDAKDFRELLTSHVCRPVLWRASVDALLDVRSEAVLVEVGPRSVLSNLLDRKWHPRVRKLHVDVDADLEMTRRHLDTVVSTLLWVESGREDVRTC